MLTLSGLFIGALGLMMRHWAMTRGSYGLSAEDDGRLALGAVLKWVGPILGLVGGVLALVGTLV